MFDLGQDASDEAILDIAEADLLARFAELQAVLGAHRVAEAVRRWRSFLSE